MEIFIFPSARICKLAVIVQLVLIDMFHLAPPCLFFFLNWYTLGGYIHPGSSRFQHSLFPSLWLLHRFTLQMVLDPDTRDHDLVYNWLTYAPWNI